MDCLGIEIFLHVTWVFGLSTDRSVLVLCLLVTVFEHISLNLSLAWCVSNEESELNTYVDSYKASSESLRRFVSYFQALKVFNNRGLILKLINESNLSSLKSD